MRFNSRACALMDIPDLPAMAFQHIGDRKIKPQGGGGGGGLGGIVSGITDPISSALGTDGGGGGILGGLADIDPGPAIGSGLADVDEFVNEEIPGGWVTPALIAAAATTGYVDPSLLGGEAAFAGASETGLATLAGEGAAATAAQVAAAEAAGATLLSEVAAATQALPYTLAADAANLAANGFDAATIAQNLTATGVDSFVASDIANLAAQGLSESAIAQNIAQGYTAAELTGTGITSTLPTSGFSISPQQALRGIRAASGLLGGGQQPQQPQLLQMGGRNIKPAGAVDYSGLYNLLALQRAPNPNSLLG